MREVLIGCEKGPVGLHRWESLSGGRHSFQAISILMVE